MTADPVPIWLNRGRRHGDLLGRDVDTGTPTPPRLKGKRGAIELLAAKKHLRQFGSPFDAGSLSSIFMTEL